MVSLTGFAPVISCLRDRRVGWATPQGQKWWGRRVLPSLPLACQTSALLMSYAPRNGVPSWISTSNLTLRTRPLCALSYGDELVRASGNAPDPGTHLVRLRL